MRERERERGYFISYERTTKEVAALVGKKRGYFWKSPSSAEKTKEEKLANNE